MRDESSERGELVEVLGRDSGGAWRINGRGALDFKAEEELGWEEAPLGAAHLQQPCDAGAQEVAAGAAEAVQAPPATE